MENELPVVLVETEAFPSLTALLLVGAGSRYENRHNNGIAHFFEHMAFKGSKKYPSAIQISSLLDSLGSQHNAFTAKDHTGYWIKAPSAHFPVVIDVLSDMVLNSLLKPAEIEREKGVIAEEINMYEDLPQYKVWDLFENVLYQDNPLGFTVTGTKDTVSSFSRQTFIDYMDRLYHPNNAVLVIAGGGLKKDYLDLVDSKFGSWQPAGTDAFTRAKEKAGGPNFLVHQKKSEQAHFILGYRALARTDKRRYVLTLLAAILGGGMSSRLFFEVRERRGLCYYIQSGVEAMAETGYLFNRAGVSPKVEKVKEAVTVILEEIAKVAAGYLRDDEIKRAKEMIKGRLILSLEDSYNTASFYGKRLLLDKELKAPQAIIKEIDRVEKEELEALAKEIFTTRKLNFAIVGPFDKSSLSLEELI